jgi:sigma-E factor negative regulatory protein RseC
MKQYGQVEEILEGDRALVRVRQNFSCGNCNCCGGFLGDPEKNRDILVEVINPVGAKKGQLVSLKASAREMLLAAFMLYLVPLIGFLLGLFAGRNWAISRSISGNPDLWGLGTGLLLMVLVFIILRGQESRLERGGRFKSIISAIIDVKELPEELRPDSCSIRKRDG